MSTGSRPRVRRRSLVVAAAAVTAAVVWSALRRGSRWLRQVSGTSMAPTLQPGEVILVLPARRTPRVGDVVVVADPRQPGRETVKRVVATAGVLTDLGGEVAPVPPGHVAVRGDHPTGSTDSRRYGAVPTTAVIGRVVARLWPPPLASLRDVLPSHHPRDER